MRCGCGGRCDGIPTRQIRCALRRNIMPTAMSVHPRIRMRRRLWVGMQSLALPSPSSSAPTGAKAINTHTLPTQFLLLECHEFADEADVGGYAFTAFDDVCVGLGEGPVVCVDEVGDDGCDRAGFPGFAVDVGGRGVEAGVV